MGGGMPASYILAPTFQNTKIKKKRNSLGRRGDDHASRMAATNWSGSPIKVWSIFQPCFLAVERTERMMAKSLAPS
jgi:hypothetical protein